MLHTHRSVAAIVQALCTAWDWHPEDRILHALPLHHMHGVANALFCAHAAGACVEFLPGFSPSAVWEALKVCAACALLYLLPHLLMQPSWAQHSAYLSSVRDLRS